MSLVKLLLGKTMVGAFFGTAVSLILLLIGVLVLCVTVSSAGLLLVGIMLSSPAFAAFGIAFASIPIRSVGSIMIPALWCACR